MFAARANRRRHDASGSPLRVARHSGKRSVPPTRSGWPVRRTTLVNHTHNKLEKYSVPIEGQAATTRTKPRGGPMRKRISVHDSIPIEWLDLERIAQVEVRF